MKLVFIIGGQLIGDIVLIIDMTRLALIFLMANYLWDTVAGRYQTLQHAWGRAGDDVLFFSRGRRHGRLRRPQNEVWNQTWESSVKGRCRVWKTTSTTSTHRVKKIHLYLCEAICWVLVQVSNRHVTSQTHKSTHLTTTRWHLWFQWPLQGLDGANKICDRELCGCMGTIRNVLKSDTHLALDIGHKFALMWCCSVLICCPRTQFYMKLPKSLKHLVNELISHFVCHWPPTLGDTVPPQSQYDLLGNTHQENVSGLLANPGKVHRSQPRVFEWLTVRRMEGPDQRRKNNFWDASFYCFGSHNIPEAHSSGETHPISPYLWYHT